MSGSVQKYGSIVTYPDHQWSEPRLGAYGALLARCENCGIDIYISHPAKGWSQPMTPECHGYVRPTLRDNTALTMLKPYPGWAPVQVNPL